MGKILRTKKLTTFAEGIIVVFVLGAILGAVALFGPNSTMNKSEANATDTAAVAQPIVTNTVTSVNADTNVSTETKATVVEQPEVVKTEAKTVKVHKNTTKTGKAKETKKKNDRENLNVNFN